MLSMKIQVAWERSTSPRGLSHPQSAPFGAKPLVQSRSCQTCGECVERCPTGALAPKAGRGSAAGSNDVGPCLRVGCSMALGVRGNRIVSSRWTAIAGESKGRALCVKGRFGTGLSRTPPGTPVTRTADPQGRITHSLTPGEPVAEMFRADRLDEALDAWQRAHRTPRETGGAAVAGLAWLLSSPNAQNEENYIVQKFARAVLRTNNVDHCARLCHSSTVVAALAASRRGHEQQHRGYRRPAALLVIGSNTTECHPIIGRRIKQNVRLNGSRLIVADPAGPSSRRWPRCTCATGPAPTWPCSTA